MKTELSTTTTLFTSHFMMQNSLVVRGRGGAAACVDPAYFPDEIDAIRSALKDVSQGYCLLLFTHGDFDHVLGLGPAPGFRAVIQEEALKADKGAVEAQCREYDEALYLSREPPFCFPAFDRTFGASLNLEKEGLPLTLVHAPGHTADSALVLNTEGEWCHAGDMLSDLEFPIVRHSFAAYRSSLGRIPGLLQEHGIIRVVPGHGRVAEGWGEIMRRWDRDFDYIDRLETEVRRLARARETLEACIEGTRCFLFGGRPIPPFQREFHEGNVRTLFAEVARKY